MHPVLQESCDEAMASQQMDYDMAAYMRARLRYDPQTGAFAWIVPTARCIKAGSAAGWKNSSGHIQIKVDGTSHMAHRLAWLMTFNTFPSGQIDHINGIRDDNRIANLRNVTTGENTQNQRAPRSDNTSGYLGVSFSKAAGKWVAGIGVGRKRIHLGCFDCPETAHLAYIKAKREMHATCTI